jgi:hypothetical protein
LIRNCRCCFCCCCCCCCFKWRAPFHTCAGVCVGRHEDC